VAEGLRTSKNMSDEKNPSTAAPASGPATEAQAEKSRYRQSLNLPKTSFPMKANLVQNEPASIKRWQKIGVYTKLREERRGKARFVFHDGPPYANGSIHLGHLFNKCLKDFVVRSRSMMGFDVPYVPGWDCHGLPIEHKVMTELVEAGKHEKLKTLDPWTRRAAVRRECQKHAEKYIKHQATQMQRLLTIADYANPYLTMAPAFEGATLGVLALLLERGLVYRALKPVHWSIANETALAEAELEYYDREDHSVYVDFEAADASAVYDAFGLPPESDEEEEADEDEVESEGATKLPRAGQRPNQRPCFMIWTTTPWTLPANVGIAVNPKFEYALAWIDGNVTVLAADAVERVAKLAGSEQVVEIARTLGKNLLGLGYRHPFVDPSRSEGVGAMNTGDTAPNQAHSKLFVVVGADYVTLEDGTGLVHTAPGHGEEDYLTGQREGLPVYCPVRGDGTYDQSVPAWLHGMSVWDANPKVTQHLRDSGHLFYSHTFMHSYPHDWRSKTPTIFRCTEQWFVGVDKPYAIADETPSSLRQRGLEATAQGVRFVPEWGRNRLRGMLESRPDWCISRQRSWGLPIPAFETPDGATFMTSATVRAVIEALGEKGSDGWFSMTPEQLLATYRPGEDDQLQPEIRDALVSGALTLGALRKGGDILDVWFESGSSWYSCVLTRGLGFTLPDRSDRVDLYLEGSDQHRGWFQLSLLPGLGVLGVPPFKTLLTHGFIVDRDGRKLSKSRADAERYEVDNLCAEFGVDVMRWWVASLTYENDVKADVELFGIAGESYRKVRNTLRFMLSNLSDFTPTCDGARGGDCTPAADFPPESIDSWVLGEYNRVAEVVINAYEQFDFKTVHKAIFDFCNTTLSADYLGAVKDRLYCDAPDSPRRRRTQTVLWDLTDGLCRLLAPILCHTADEAYRSLWKAADTDERCVHTQEFIRRFDVQASPAWAGVPAVREAAKSALEQAKADMGVENPLDAGIELPASAAELAGLDAVDLADLLGVSEVKISPSAGQVRVIDLRDRPRCERSWKRDGTVKQRSDGGILSDRDAAVLGLA
jgi:isoleucyl-tRNA synthetase